MIRQCIVFFSWLLVSTSAAQQPIVDSLIKQLDHHQAADTFRVSLYNSLSLQYQWTDFNKSLQYAQQALSMAEVLQFERGIATACFRQAHCLWALGDSDRAIEKGLQAVNIADQHGYVDVKAETYRILAISYRDQQENSKAVWYIRQAETLALRERNWDLLARVYNLAGVIECTREKNDSALIYYNKALAITAGHATTQFHVSQVLSNIGELYLANDTDKALAYFARALSSAKDTQNKSAEAGIMADIGRASILKKNYTDADKYLKLALALARQLGLKRVIRHAYLALAELKIQGGQNKRCVEVHASILRCAR